jgi:hypothetical protein
LYRIYGNKIRYLIKGKELKKLLLILSIVFGSSIALQAVEDPVGTKTVFGGAYNAVETVGDYAYVASGAGLKVFDISNPTSPSLVGKKKKKRIRR